MCKPTRQPAPSQPEEQSMWGGGSGQESDPFCPPGRCKSCTAASTVVLVPCSWAPRLKVESRR